MNILVLCTGNSARSIMAEAILNHISDEGIHAYSAGSTPRGEVNPLAIELLQSRGYITEKFRSKSWNEFISSPEMDVVITVCDNAANEICPVWPGHPITGHWAISDPDQPDLSIEEQCYLFKQAYENLEKKIRQFVERDPENLDDKELKALLDRIGETG